MNRCWQPGLILVALISLLAFGAAAAQEGSEMTITLDSGVVGILAQPAADGPVPAVLMLHGFGSQKDEVGDMYKRLAASLTEAGIASLRIDFRGWGESGGAMTDSTLVGMVEDAAEAYAYLTAQDFVDTARVGVLGFSLGGRIAIVSGAQNPAWYRSMAVWSTGADIPADFLGQDKLDTASAEGQVTIDLGWREVTLGKGFFESLSAYRMEEEFVQYPNSFMVIAGADDPDPAGMFDWYLDQAQGALRMGYLIPGGDHIYQVLTEDQTMAEQVIAMTVNWFEMSL